MTKVKQTQKELENHLNEQIHFLEVSAENFDQGDNSEAKRMAVHIRTLLHDTYKKDGSPNSQSLLKLLDLKDKDSFFDSSSSKNIIGPYTGLVLKSVGPSGGKYVAPLDDLPPTHVSEEVQFDDYWEREIFADNKGNNFSRKTLILAIANQDGGAHIDPELNRDYAELTRQNSLGWIYGNAVESGDLENASLAAVRQITHEILKTLIDNYPEKKLLNTQDSVILGDIHIEKGFTAGQMVNVPPKPSSDTKKEEKE